MSRAGVVVAFFIAAGTAWAQLEDPLTDPPTLHIGPGITGATCTSGPNLGLDVAMGCATTPNLIPGNRLDIFQEKASAAALVTPLVLILGVPNDPSGGSAFGPGNIIDHVTLYHDYSTAPAVVGDVTFQYGMTSNRFGFPKTDALTGAAKGYQGVMSVDDVYSALQVGGPALGVDNSVRMSNLGPAESNLGIPTDNLFFGLYIFSLNIDLDTRTFVGKSLLDVWFKSPLPLGTFATAYGRTDVGTPYVTTWTNTGLVVPEPSTLWLLGCALLLGGALARGKLRHRP